MLNVATVVSTFVNFIRKKEMNHRQFKDVFSGTESEYRGVLYRKEVP
jgi:hypothetical protein